MARGWESKNIEAQQEEASSQTPRGPAPTAAQLTLRERRLSLELARNRAVDDLARASAPAHRHMLELAIASLDERITALG